VDLQFNVEMTDLRKHINFVRNGLGNSKTDLPVMLLRFETKGSKSVVFAANKEMFCRTEMKIERPIEGTIEDGSFAVYGHKVESLISQVDAEKVSFQADDENLQIQAGFLTVNFETFDGTTLKTVEQGVSEHLELEGLAVEKAALEEALVCARSCATSTITSSEGRPNDTPRNIASKTFLSKFSSSVGGSVVSICPSTAGNSLSVFLTPMV